MKIDVKLILIVLLLAIAIALIFYSSGLKDNGFDSSSPDEKSENTESPKKSPPHSGTLNQLMNQNQSAVPSGSAGESEAAEEDDGQDLQEALNDFYSAEDEQDRESALMTLGEYTDPKAKEAILYALNDPADNVREQAISQISGWEDDKERQQMQLQALSNDKPEIVVLTLESISDISDPALLEKVKALSHDANEDVSEAAKVALELAEI